MDVAATGGDRAPVLERCTDQVAALAELQARREDGERFPRSATPLGLSGVRLVDADLSGLDLSEADLSYAQLVHCNLRGTRLVRADLTGSFLRDADLGGAELLGADLSGADLSNANLVRAGLLQATATDAVLFGARCTDASFTGADLRGADLRAGELTGASLAGADLERAELANAVLAGADLSGANLDEADLGDADLRGGRLRNVQGYRTANWIDADITDVDFTGAWNVRRYIQDTNYIDEFRNQSRAHGILYWLWWVTSDCGRSLLRWSLWTALVAMSYAVAYAFADVDFGPDATVLSPLYFSVVTFTTLGYGDALPRSEAAQLLAISEVVLGYLGLGGMMSILADKMARRAG